MILSEYETSEQFEIIFLFDQGFPYEIDRENPRKIKFIFKGDLDFIKGRLQDFRNGILRVDPLKYSYSWQSVKRLMWVDGQYNPKMNQHFHENKFNENKNEQPEQEKQGE